MLMNRVDNRHLHVELGYLFARLLTAYEHTENKKGLLETICWLNIDMSLTLTTYRLYTNFQNILTLEPSGFKLSHANSVAGATPVSGSVKRLPPICVIASLLHMIKYN